MSTDEDFCLEESKMDNWRPTPDPEPKVEKREMLDTDYNIECARNLESFEARHIAQGRDSYKLEHSWWSIFVPKALILSVQQMEVELDGWRKPRKVNG